VSTQDPLEPPGRPTRRPAVTRTRPGPTAITVARASRRGTTGAIRVAHRGTSPVTSAGLRSLLASFPDRVGFVLEEARPDVVIVDLSGVRGVPRAPSLAVPLVALARDDDLVQLCAAGVHVVDAAADGATLLGAIERAHALGRAATATSEHRVGDAVDDDLPSPLSSRERETLDGICRGMSNDELAASMFVSVNSIKTYIRSAYREIGVERRGQAIVWGLHNGFGDPQNRT